MKKTRRARSERAGRLESSSAAAGEGSRDSSVSSCEVRCACQYFQSDSLLPERTALVLASRPSSRASGGVPAMAAAMGDHEYEPISPPPDVKMEPENRRRRSSSEAAGSSSVDSPERRYLRTPLEDTVAFPGDGELEDEAMAGRELGDTNNGDTNTGDDEEDQPEGAAELQARLEERFLNGTPTTTGSRTDGEFNTSNVDSSALEDLPLQKEARKLKQQEEEESQKSRAGNFQQRVRSQAGKLRTRLRNIKKPTFSMPERPKITLPERPKFHLPERPKFNLPQRPKFNLPERPKFTMPERPKFNLPQRPKISMPTLSSLTSKTKGRSVFSSTRRPLRERSANVSTVSTTSSKKKMFDFDFRTYPRLFERKFRSKQKGQRAETPPPTTPSRKKGPVGVRWLHRFKDITYADEDVGQPTSSEGTRVAFESQESGEQVDPEEYVWEEREKKGLNEDLDNSGIQRQDSGQTESMTGFKDKDLGYAVSMEVGALGPVRQQMASSSSIPESDQEQRSSGSSSDRHRAGVLEEIDSDEFFLRQKGISQEDVVLGRMLTSEIRDAFRAPPGANALKHMDSYEYYDDENEVDDNLANQYRGTPEREPTRPARTRSLRPRKRSSKSKESSPTEEQVSSTYNTFPPTRPKRNRPGRKQEDVVDSGKEAVKIDDKMEHGAEKHEGEMEQEESEPVPNILEETLQQTGRPNLPTEEYEENEEIIRDDVIDDPLEVQEVELPEREESPAHPEIIITGAHDQEMFDQQIPEEEHFDDRLSQQWRYENEDFAENPPTAPRRKKRTLKQSLPDSLCNGSYTKEDWMENVNGHITPDEIIALRMESEYIIPDVADGEEFEMPPIAPKRGRRKSKSSRGPSLMEDDDRTSHGASPLPAEEAPPEIDIGDMGGYAFVIKPVPVKPTPEQPERPKRPKPARPPPPGRRKKLNGSKFSHFFSLPRKPPPLRPVRNYSTLGPSRPPRRERFAGTRYIQQNNLNEPYIEIEGDDLDRTQQEESHDSSRDLQSGDIIEKMKGRPLPPPPRPPRKSKEGRDTLSQFDEDEALQGMDGREEHEDIALAALKDDVFYSNKGSINSLQHERLRVETTEGVSIAQQTSLDPEEISVYTQTDPLLEEYCEDLIVGEPLKEHVRPVRKQRKSPKKEIELDKSALYADELDVPTTGQDEEIIESAVLGRLICRSEASPESTVLEQETRKSPVLTYKPPTPPREIRTHTIIEKHIPIHVGPDENTEVEFLRAQRLQVSELDVERLNVGELQAQKILVSDIDGVSMQVAELTSKSGNLVVSGIELPPGFMQELYDARPSTTTHVIMECSSTQTTASPEEFQPSSMPPAGNDTQRQEISQALPAQQPYVHEGSPAVQVQPIAFSSGVGQSYVSPQFSHLASTTPQMQTPLGMHFMQMGPGSGYIHSPETYQHFAREFTPPVPPPPRLSSHQRSHTSGARELESEDEVVGVVPPATPGRRRRHHATRPVSRYSSDEEEEEYAAPPTPPQFHPPGRRHPSRPVDAPVAELGWQLVHALESTAGRWARRAWLVFSPTTEDRRRDLQTALCALLVLVAMLILLGFGSGKTFHHHHWDYYFPPPL